MSKRPLTAKEIQEQQVPVDNSTITIANISRQTIKIHMKPPEGVDFFLGAQDVSLKPNQKYPFRSNRLWMEQVDRLCKQGYLQIIGKNQNKRTIDA